MLCQKYPRKHSVMMQFLSSMLREEGGFEYKKSIVNTIITIIDDNGDGKEAGLSHLCEFIEDCEHTVSHWCQVLLLLLLALCVYGLLHMSVVLTRRIAPQLCYVFCQLLGFIKQLKYKHFCINLGSLLFTLNISIFLLL